MGNSWKAIQIIEFLKVTFPNENTSVFPLLFAEAANGDVLCENMFLNISQISQESTSWSPFLIKLQERDSNASDFL